MMGNPVRRTRGCPVATGGALSEFITLPQEQPTMDRILVPLDGSEFAEQALEPALSLAVRTGAELHLASIVSDLPPVPLASGDGDLVSRWFDEEKERARGYLEGVQERLVAGGATVPVSPHVRVGPVTRSLERLCRELDIDLGVLTTHGRGAWQRTWLGSVADQLIRSGSVPLLLLRETAEPPFRAADEPRHVLVPLDGSEAGETVFSVLQPLLPAEGGRVTLVSVLQQPFPLSTTYLPHAVTEEALLQERRARIEEYLGEAASRLRGAGVAEVRTELLVGDDAARRILDFIGTEAVDLVALSTRGRGGVSRFLLGSVADKLVRGAKVPVLTARRPTD